MLISKKFYNTDIRQEGSKNAGATNVGRVLGRKAGFLVFALDVLKSAIPFWIVWAILCFVPFGNNTFIMISGCFSASKTSFNIDQFLSFLFEIYTYYYPSIFIDKKLKNKYKYIYFPNFRNKTIYMPILI